MSFQGFTVSRLCHSLTYCCFIQVLPRAVCNLLDALLKQSRHLHDWPKDIGEAARGSYPLPSGDRNAWALNELWETGCWLPHHPLQRKVAAKYLADSHNDSDSCCKKFSAEKGKNMPGLLLVFCLDHQKCIGFMLLQNKESPRTVMELLFSRWAVCPKEVHYDNGCNTHTFCMYREPYFFRDCRFFIDKFHVASHSECSPTYDPRYMSQFAGVNTQLMEQTNSKVAYLGPKSYHMGQLSFLQSVLQFMTSLNDEADTARNGGLVDVYRR